MTPIITRWQRRVAVIFWTAIAAVVAPQLAISVLWSCREWTTRHFGWDIAAARQQGNILLDGTIFRSWTIWILVIVVMGSSILLRFWVRREKLAVADGKRPCVYCLYDLQGHGARGTCPECGEAFDIAQIERYFVTLSDTGRSESRTGGGKGDITDY